LLQNLYNFVSILADSFQGYEYPPAVQFMGWGLELVSIAIVVVVSVITIIQNTLRGEDSSFVKPGPMMTPKESWGPRDDRDDKEDNSSEMGVDNENFKL